MPEGRISVLDVAAQCGKRKTTIFKVISRLGIETQKLKSPERHGQLIAYITEEDAEQIKSELESSSRSLTDNGPSPSLPELGVFYLIQLEPDLEPGRFKVGFASNMNERLRSHRCSAPYAKVVKTWECKSLWEKTAIDAVCNECEQLHTEVFRTDSIDDVIARCDQFFSFMPSLAEEDED